MPNASNCKLYHTALLLCAVCACGRELMADPEGVETIQTSATEVVVQPDEYTRALRNPHKGFTDRGFNGDNEWATLAHSYIRWNEIENDAADGIEKIQAWCNSRWQGVELSNTKVIPRVYLHWDGDRKYWPADMHADDYSSAEFKDRTLRLIDRLGQVWDRDPRVAHVEMGLVGKWGEHHSPAPDGEMQQWLGVAFMRAFQQKQVLVRHPWEFADFEFGIYWDSWAHANQLRHGAGIFALGDRWHRRLIGGEVAYNWGDYRIQPGDSPTDTVVDLEHRRHLIDSIRRLHCSQLRWVADYDTGDERARAGAEEVQKAFGYRLVIDEVSYPRHVDPGAPMHVSFTVRNTGSAPFYYDWPVEVALLDAKGRHVVWSDVFAEADIRRWLPGDKWDSDQQAYTIAPEIYSSSGDFALPEDIERGVYILAFNILDPAGDVPAARFAISNYFAGGRHPIGYIGVGREVERAQLPSGIFDDPHSDAGLYYLR